MLTLTISGRVNYQLIKQAQWVKSQPAMQEITGDSGSIPGSGRSPGGGNGNPPQDSCLENPMDRGIGQSHGLVGYSPWSRKELDRTEDEHENKSLRNLDQRRNWLPEIQKLSGLSFQLFSLLPSQISFNLSRQLRLPHQTPLGVHLHSWDAREKSV